jgi:hypothetical protein
MLSRRGFLIGTGGLLTTAFVGDARAFIRRNEAPLLAAPPRTAHTLYWDWPSGLDEPQLFLDGEPEVIAPTPPTWRVFLNRLIDAKDYTASEIKLRLEQVAFESSQFDEEMDGSWWEMHYDRIFGPSAKAYRLLERIDLGPDLGRSGDGPHLQFKEGGGNPFDYSLHVHASDMLALSLLQARLIDLRLPIKIEEWKYR